MARLDFHDSYKGLDIDCMINLIVDTLHRV